MYHLFIKNKRKTGHGTKSAIRQSKLKNSMNVYKIVGDYTPVTFIPKMNRAKKVNVYKHILDLETHKMSSLVPDIRFYRVRDEFYEPLYFPVSSEMVTAESLLSPGSGIGGMGIKSFSVSFTGNNPFSFDKQISCDLQIYVDNLENIFKDPPPGYAKLADLFTLSNRGYVPLKDGLSQESSSEKVYRPSNYEISARMGYSVPTNSEILTPQERTAILNTGLSIRMTIIDHTIDVKQDGTAIISISYTGRLEGILKDSSLSLMRQPEELLLMAQFLAEGVSEKKTDQVTKEEKEKMESQQRLQTKTLMRKYFSYLSHQDVDSENDRLHRISISPSEIEAYKRYESVKQIEEDIREQNEGQGEEQIEDLIYASGQASRDIHFVFVGDMIESMSYNVRSNIEKAIAQARKRETEEGKDMEKSIQALQKSADLLKNVKILLGEVPLKISATDVRKINLADVPVSMEIFTKYFFDEIEQQSKTTLSVKKFLDDIATRIIKKALSGHNDIESPFLASNIQIRTLNITGPRSNKLTESEVEVSIDDLPDFIKRSNPKRKSEECEYYVVYAETTESDTSGLAGDIRDDVNNGIYHFHIGKNRGMLKSVGFSKMDVKGKKEALMLSSTSLYDELKMPYTARISMFGNGLFLPGSMVYVNPSSIGFGDPRNKRSAAARLGLGGYYQIISVNTSFDGSSMTTELETSYTSWADKDTSMLSELTPHLESKVDSVPSRSTNTDVEGNQRPVTSTEKAGDFETLLSSDLLTKQEKDDIVQLELGANPSSRDSVSRESQMPGIRGYVTKRNGADIRVEITNDNEVSISRVSL